MRKFSIFTLLVVFALAFASCEQDVERVIYKGTGGADAAFSSTVLKRELASSEQGVLPVTVYRGNAKSAAEVAITITDASGLFSLQTPTASFAAGENETTINLIYNFGALNPIATYVVNLAIGADDASAAAQKTMKLELKMKLEYSFYGVGEFTSEFYEETWPVDFHKAAGAEAYIMKDCYFAGYDISFILNGTEVIVKQQNIGWLYSEAYGYVFFTPSSSKIIDGGVEFTTKFALPAAGLAFTGEFLEVAMFPTAK